MIERKIIFFKIFLKICTEPEPETELEPYEGNKKSEPELEPEPCQNGTLLQH
jgi:hypothetical protein